jgi:CHAT domain-containing protein
VTSGRDLVRRRARLPPRSPATIVAAPEYGRGGGFVRLGNAAAEAAEVSAHFPGARMLTGNQATKSAFAAIAGPAILHVATHGFFARGAAAAAPVAVPPGLPAMPALGSTDRAMYVEGVLAPPRPAGFDDPGEALDRAGLALANANLGPDGIVTAREIANYDWWGTRLVVLSACETGVGAMPSGEGVYGLRRALALAGTESQIVSLWNVNDASVRALMRGFYDQLARGVARAEALRLAKLRMLQQPAFAHPYYWAPFIADGDWTALGNVGVARR